MWAAGVSVMGVGTRGQEGQLPSSAKFALEIASPTLSATVMFHGMQELQLQILTCKSLICHPLHQTSFYAVYMGCVCVHVGGCDHLLINYYSTHTSDNGTGHSPRKCGQDRKSAIRLLVGNYDTCGIVAIVVSPLNYRKCLLSTLSGCVGA